MIKLKTLLGCCLALALLSSCAHERQYTLVGHYKPHTQAVAKEKQPATPAASSEELASLNTGKTDRALADASETHPDLRLIQSQLHERIAALSEQQQQALSKKLAQVQRKMEKQIANHPQEAVQKEAHHFTDLKSMKADDDELLYVIIAILLPPLAVALYENDITNHFWIDLILWLLLYIPGLIYALYIILSD